MALPTAPFFLPYFLEHEHVKVSQNILRLFLSEDETLYKEIIFFME